jgi:hypothetical protein
MLTPRVHLPNALTGLGLLAKVDAQFVQILAQQREPLLCRRGHFSRFSLLLEEKVRLSEKHRHWSLMQFINLPLS